MEELIEPKKSKTRLWILIILIIIAIIMVVYFLLSSGGSAGENLSNSIPQPPALPSD